MPAFECAMRKLALASGGAVLAFAAYATPIAAQTAPASPETRNGEEDIIVTARRREERLQDVPTAVTALTAETLSTLNIRKTEDLTTIAAGLNVTRQGDRNRVFFDLRGQGQANNGGEPGVQIYFDEVPLLRGGLDFFDIGQIEVMRGPQGTLFGRNTTGGAVRIRPALPTFELDGYVEGRMGSLNTRDIEAAVNVPIVDDVLAMRVAGTIIRRDGYVKNLVNGQDIEDEHTDAFRAQLLFKPSDRFENRTLFSYRHMDTNGQAFFPNKVNPLGPPAQVAFDLGRSSNYRQIRSDMVQAARAEEYVAENVASFELSDNITVRHIFGYVQSKTTTNYDVDGTELPLLVSFKDDRGRTITNELQFFGKAMDGKLDWFVGGYYEDSKTIGPDNTLQFIAFGSDRRTVARLDGTSKALFAQGTYEFTPQLSLTAGYRHTWDVRNGEAGTGLGAPPTTFVTTRFKKNAPNWTLSLNYKPNADLLIYAATRRGYKSGGVNPFALGTLPTGFGLEKLTDIELGVKSTFDTGDVSHRLNVAGFYGWYSNMQRAGVVTAPPPFGGPVALIYNAGNARISGVEVEYNAKYREALDFGLQYSYLNVDFRNYTFVDGSSLLNQEAANSPKHKVTLFGSLYAPIDEAQGRLYLNAKYAYQSHIFLAEPNVAETAQPAFGLLDASLNWDSVLGSNIDASVFVRNLTNERNFIGQGFPAFAMVTVGPPRIWGAKLKVRFGASAD